MWWILFKFATFVPARKSIIEAAKRIINSDKVCHSYSDLNFGVTFLKHSVHLLHVAAWLRPAQGLLSAKQRTSNNRPSSLNGSR